MIERSYFDLLRRTLAVLAVCTAAVVACYFWVDRPVAFFVEQHRLSHFVPFRWLTYPPPWLQTWSPLILSVLVILWAFRPAGRCQKLLFVALISLIVADQFRTSLGDVCGRYWPETWRDNNPSLIGTGAYGFHPFEHGDDVGSFPSGHAARIVAFAGVFWIGIPRSRALLAVICLPMLASLVLMNYHFVGDVIAGSVVGGIVATYACHLAASQMLPTGD